MAHETDSVTEEIMRTDRLWNVREAAEFLGLSAGTVYHLASQRRIPRVKLSARCLRFQPDEIIEWVKQKSEKGDVK